jgi:hypothetical protein
MEENGSGADVIEDVSMTADLKEVARTKRVLDPDAASYLFISGPFSQSPLHPLTIASTECILTCLESDPRIISLKMCGFRVNVDAVFTMLCARLPSTTVRHVSCCFMSLGNEGLLKLVPACVNIASLDICGNQISGEVGGETL